MAHLNVFALIPVRRLLSLALAGGLLIGCASAPQVDIPTTVPELRPGILIGYLPRAALPDSLALLPPPPAPGSPAQAADEAAFLATVPLRGSPRWNLAASDANLVFPKAADAFACALNAPIGPEATPNLYMLLRRSLTDVDAAGVIQSRKLKVIYAAYARDNDEKRKLGESINLAYQRSTNERLQKLQLQLFLDVYDFSAVGLEPETYISLEMPARQKFPLIHMVARPLAKRWGFEEKKDGSDTAEIEDSLTLLRNTLAQAGK
mgnify:CR=1 FL=1